MNELVGEEFHTHEKNVDYSEETKNISEEEVTGDKQHPAERSCEVITINGLVNSVNALPYSTRKILKKSIILMTMVMLENQVLTWTTM